MASHPLSNSVGLILRELYLCGVITLVSEVIILIVTDVSTVELGPPLFPLVLNFRGVT